MPATVKSAAVVGIDAVPVDVEVEELSGLPSVTIVGLPDAAVKEAKARIVAAIANTGLTPPKHKVIINLQPAHVRKEGPQYDLPIALAFLKATGQVVRSVDGTLFAGALGLDGSLQPVPGMLAIADAARSAGMQTLVVAPGNVAEAVSVGLPVVAPTTLQALIDHVEGKAALAPAVAPPGPSRSVVTESVTDFSVITGQAHAKRALEIAAAGGHNVLLHGPPGAGKSLLAKALLGILPDLAPAEAFEATKIWSVRGLLAADAGLLRARPFRSPHHSVSAVALIGGGTHPQPGEVTLAHHGVLFLDEFAEFPRHVLEHLRQPLEDGVVHVSRAAGARTFPARFTLVAAMNPCPCGYHGDPHHACTCTPTAITRYRQRVSGPLLDRIDMHVQVPPVPPGELLRGPQTAGEASAAVRERVRATRARQTERFGDARRTNATLTVAELKEQCVLPENGTALLETAAKKLALSARSIHRVLRLARTIADMGGAERIAVPQLAEALQYRTPFSDL